MKISIQAVEKMTKNDDSWRKDYDSGTLMPILAANVSKLGIKPETALHMLNMGYAMLWVLVMFFLCRDVFDDDKAGLLGMSLAAFNPYSVRLSSQILREPLYILIFTLSLWCALRFIENKKYYLYPAMLGMLTILGFFVRYEGIEISLFLPLAIFVIFIQYKMQYVRVCVYSFAAYLLSVGLLVGALVNFNNSYMCNASQKAVGYFELFTGNRVK